MLCYLGSSSINYSLSFSSRSEDHCRSCDRVREESPRRDHPHHVLVECVRAHGSPDLHGRAHAEVHPEVPDVRQRNARARRLHVRESHGRVLVPMDVELK